MNLIFKFDEEILIYAFRYCLGRMSYAVSICVDNILDNWDNLTPAAKDLIYKEIKDCNDLGMDIDAEEWNKIIDKYESNK